MSLLKLPPELAINEQQTEKRLSRLIDQDPDAALVRFPGWESDDPEAKGRGIKAE